MTQTKFFPMRCGISVILQYYRGNKVVLHKTVFDTLYVCKMETTNAGIASS